MAEGTKSKKQFKIVIERDEDGYFVASVPALPGCYTQAKSLQELNKRVREAISLCLSVATQNRVYREKIKRLSYSPTFVGVDVVSV